jgi:hypothetical protein
LKRKDEGKTEHDEDDGEIKSRTRKRRRGIQTSKCMEQKRRGRKGERKNKVRKLNNFYLIFKKVNSSENNYSSKINFIFDDIGLRRRDYFIFFRDISTFVITVSLTSRLKQLNECIGLKITFQASARPISYYSPDGLYKSTVRSVLQEVTGVTVRPMSAFSSYKS